MKINDVEFCAKTHNGNLISNNYWEEFKKSLPKLIKKGDKDEDVKKIQMMLKFLVVRQIILKEYMKILCLKQ